MSHCAVSQRSTTSISKPVPFQILQLVLTAWAGSLWAICLIVAPSLFVVVADRQLAGAIAGHLFRIETWLGLALGGIVLLLLSKSASALRVNTNYVLVTLTVTAPVSNEVVIRPLMDEARAAGDTRMFGILHGAGAALLLFACITVLALVWRIAAKTQRES